MQSSLTNPDRRPLPEGWTSHFDPRRRLWFYINLNETPPRTTYLHPEDEDPPSPPIANNPLPPMNNILPMPTVHPHASTQGTPFSNASHAYRARRPTFAQQLYASATTAKNIFPTPTNSDEESELPVASTYLTNIPLPTSSPPEDSNLFSTASSSLPSSSPLPSPPLSPIWSHPPHRRPRGARNSTFPRPLPVTSPAGFTLPPVNEIQGACDFRDRALFNSRPPDPTPPSTLHDSQNGTTFRHHRSASLPSIKTSVAKPLAVGIRSNPRETPMYSTVASPLQTSANPATITTPAFQNLSPLPAGTVNPPAVFPLSDLSQIQPNLQLGNTSQPVPNATPSPVLGEVRDNQQAESDRNRKALKKVGLAVGKSAGKMALRMGAKMALGSIGVPVDTSDMFPSDGNGVLDTIAAGVSEMATSAAAAGVSQVLNAATSPSAATNTSPPPQSIPPQPTLPIVPPQPPIDPSSYAAILNQMHAMQLTQPQQNHPSQLPVHSPAEYASILAQMQASQMQATYGVQRPPLPSSNFQGIQPPSSQATVSHVNTVQPPQNNPAQGRWQQNLMNSVIGGATNALVSSAVNNIDFTGAATSAYSDFTGSA